MSNLLACILAYIIVRDKNDAGIKEMCPTGYFGNLVPRVSHLPAQARQARLGGKMRGPGNEVATFEDQNYSSHVSTSR